MAWQYRPPSPEVEAANTLSRYHAQLRADEARDRFENNLDTEPSAVNRINLGRLRNVVFLWAIAVLAIVGVATWFLDRVLAAEILGVVTAIVVFTTLTRRRLN